MNTRRTPSILVAAAAVRAITAGGAVRRPTVRHDSRLWGWLAALAVIALLGGFGRVVRHIVDRGAERHVAERERHSATWRCQLLATRQDRADCNRALN